VQTKGLSPGQAGRRFAIEPWMLAKMMAFFVPPAVSGFKDGVELFRASGCQPASSTREPKLHPNGASDGFVDEDRQNSLALAPSARILSLAGSTLCPTGRFGKEFT
jgi:hypothetical protein